MSEVPPPPAGPPSSEPAAQPAPSAPSAPPVPGSSVPPPSTSDAYPVPPPPAPIVAPPARKAASWTGVGIAIGGVLALVAGFLQYVKLEFPPIGTYAFTGLGAETVTGRADASQFTPGNPGRTLFVIGIVLIVLGLLVVARLGRLWVGIVSLIVAAIGVVLGIVALAEPSRDADSFRSQARAGGAAIEITGSIGIGAILATIGAVVAVVFGILALVVRQRAARSPGIDDAPAATAGTGPEPGLAS